MSDAVLNQFTPPAENAAIDTTYRLLERDRRRPHEIIQGCSRQTG